MRSLFGPVSFNENYIDITSKDSTDVRDSEGDPKPHPVVITLKHWKETI